MLEKRLFLGIVLLFVVVFGIGVVSAVHAVSVSDDGTTATATVAAASNIYAYEVNFSYTGTVSGVSFTNFLTSDGASASTGFNKRGDYLYVYASRLDSSQTGINGAGDLFDVTHSGTLTLKGSMQIDSSGNEEHVSYNAGVADSTSSSTTTTPVGVGFRSSPSEVSLDTDDGLSIDAIYNLEDKREIVIKNNGDEDIRLTIVKESLGDLIDVPNTILIEAGEDGIIELKITSDSRELIAGKILLKYKGVVVKEIDVILNTQSENFLFDSSINLADVSRIIGAGDLLRAQIDLLQVGRPEKVDVVATYIIKDFAGITYLEESETFFVEESKDFVKEFSTEGLEMPPGKYILGMELVYPGAFATSSTQFVIEEKGLLGISGLGRTEGLIIGGVLLFIVILTVIILKMRGGKGKKGKK